MEKYVDVIQKFAAECGVDGMPCGVAVSEQEDGEIFVGDDWIAVKIDPVATCRKIEQVDHAGIESADQETRQQIFWDAIVEVDLK